MNLSENSLEWALIHLRKFQSSDFFPFIFEFDAIAFDWNRIKKHLLQINLAEYSPKTPLSLLALKNNKSFRVVHQLDPIDSIIYTALIYEVSEIIENYRVPEKEQIACSYRIKPTKDGRFFNDKQNGWQDYTVKTELLSKKYKNGYILTCDITDFYNQIYTHRVNNIISEAGGESFEAHAKIIEKFLLGLNAGNSRGIPVGPAPSIILAETIMSDIDRKILTYTRDFARYVDDIRIFVESENKAIELLHELTDYLYTSHRLVFASAKTSIKKVHVFLEKDFINPEKEATIAKTQKQEELVLTEIDGEDLQRIGWYFFGIDNGSEEEVYKHIYEQIGETKGYEILAEVYKDIFKKTIAKENPDKSLLKYILLKATRYRTRGILQYIFPNLEKLLPVIREVSVYLKTVLNKQAIKENKEEIIKLVNNQHLNLPYVNLWISFLVQSNIFEDKEIDFKDYGPVKIRDQALIAKRLKNTTFIKGYKERLDVLGPWDKRAVMFASAILSKDEQRHWLKRYYSSEDILEAAVAKYSCN